VIGKRLSRAVRSHGSMLLLDFGHLTRGQGPRGRDHVRGEWMLVVEWSDWSITAPGSLRVTDRSGYALIDKTLPLLRKQPVCQLAFNANGRLDRQWWVAFRCSRRFVIDSGGRVAQ
jgi:hypothetical protein